MAKVLNLLFQFIILGNAPLYLHGLSLCRGVGFLQVERLLCFQTFVTHKVLTCPKLVKV